MRSLLALLLCAACLPALAFRFCDDREARIEFHRSLVPLEKAFLDQRFDEVDRRLNEMLRDHDEGRLDDAIVDRAFWMFDGRLRHAPLHEEWARRLPNSPAAHLAFGYHLVNRGAAERGDAPWAQLSETARHDARAAFRDALVELRLAERGLARPTLPAALRIRIAALDPQAGAGNPVALYRAAIKAHPGTLAVRIQYVKASHPQWGGSVRRLEGIRKDASGMAPDDRRYVEYLATQELGRAAEWAKDDSLAARHYEHSFPLCMGVDNSIEKLAQLYDRTRKHEQLARVASRMLERTPRNGWALSLRGGAYRELGRHADAVADFKRATELGYGPAFEALAWFYETGSGVTRDLARALDLYIVAETREDGPSKGHVQRVRTLLGSTVR